MSSDFDSRGISWSSGPSVARFWFKQAVREAPQREARQPRPSLMSTPLPRSPSEVAELVPRTLGGGDLGEVIPTLPTPQGSAPANMPTAPGGHGGESLPASGIGTPDGPPPPSPTAAGGHGGEQPDARIVLDVDAMSGDESASTSSPRGPDAPSEEYNCGNMGDAYITHYAMMKKIHFMSGVPEETVREVVKHMGCALGQELKRGNTCKIARVGVFRPLYRPATALDGDAFAVEWATKWGDESIKSLAIMKPSFTVSQRLVKFSAHFKPKTEELKRKMSYNSSEITEGQRAKIHRSIQKIKRVLRESCSTPTRSATSHERASVALASTDDV